MKFSVSAKDLKTGLQHLISVIPNKTTFPILNYILIKSETDRISLLATDLDVSLRTNVPAKIEEEGVTVIPGKLLNDFVRALSDVELTFVINEDKKITISHKFGVTKLSGENEEEFPAFPEVDVLGELNISSSKFQRMVNSTLFAVSADELQTTLTGVFNQFKQNEWCMVATDGHRLVRIIDKTFKFDEDLPEIIIPPKALNLVLKNIEEAELLNIKISNSYVIFDLPESTIITRLIDGRYPNYEKVIPLHNEKKLRVNKDSLVSSLKRVALFSNRITQQVKLVLGKDKIEMFSQNVEMGSESHETIPAVYDNDEVTIGYNFTYLLDSVLHVDTEEVVFEFESATSAGLVFPDEQQEGEDLLMLVMPIKLVD